MISFYSTFIILYFIIFCIVLHKYINVFILLYVPYHWNILTNRCIISISFSNISFSLYYAFIKLYYPRCCCIILSFYHIIFPYPYIIERQKHHLLLFTQELMLRSHRPLAHTDLSVRR